MINTFGISAVLSAIPELKSVAPAHYPRLLADAEKTSFSTQWSHWRAVFVGILVCIFYIFPSTTSSGGSFMLQTFVQLGFAWIILFLRLLLFAHTQKCGAGGIKQSGVTLPVVIDNEHIQSTGIHHYHVLLAKRSARKSSKALTAGDKCLRDGYSA
jgi:hypothetical protein